jgi:hypothetical protein
VTAAAAVDDQQLRVRSISDLEKLAPGLTEDLMKILERTQGSVSVRELRDALETRGVNSAVELFPWGDYQDDTQIVITGVMTTAIEWGALAEWSIAAGTAIAFDLDNSGAVQWAQNHAASKVVGITNATRAALRTLVVQSFQEGVTPRRLAENIRPWIGLHEQDAQSVTRFLVHQLDVEQVGFAEAMRRTNVYAQARVRERAITIARTEIMDAMNEGHRVAWIQAQEQGLVDLKFVERRWVAARDGRVCPICRALDGRVIGFDQDFSAVRSVTPRGGGGPVNRVVTRRRPPAHPRCRCRIVSRTVRTRR